MAASAVSTTSSGARRRTGTPRSRVAASRTTAAPRPSRGCHTAIAPAATAPIATASTAGPRGRGAAGGVAAAGAWEVAIGRAA